MQKRLRYRIFDYVLIMLSVSFFFLLVYTYILKAELKTAQIKYDKLELEYLDSQTKKKDAERYLGKTIGTIEELYSGSYTLSTILMSSLETTNDNYARLMALSTSVKEVGGLVEEISETVATNKDLIQEYEEQRGIMGKWYRGLMEERVKEYPNYSYKNRTYEAILRTLIWNEL